MSASAENVAVTTVQRHMTSSPHTIGRVASLEEAERFMTEHRIRHLPVVDGEALVGILSERDVHLARSLRGAVASELRVEDAMTPSPYSVAPETPLADVAAEMATFRYGSAVVMKGGKIVGIFTAVDGLRALAQVLRSPGG